MSRAVSRPATKKKSQPRRKNSWTASRRAGALRMFPDLGLLNLSFILLGLLVVILASGVWIAVGLGLIGFVAMLFTTNVPIGAVLATTVWSATASWTLAALPLFIWMGEILFRTKL